MNHVNVFRSINTDFVLVSFVNYNIDVFPVKRVSSELGFLSLKSVLDSSCYNCESLEIVFFEFFSMISIWIIISNETSIIVSFSELCIVNH